MHKRVGHTPLHLGLSVPAIVALAALAVPRAVAHDLDLLNGFGNAMLAIVPLLVWLGVALCGRIPNPFSTLLAVGLVYGLCLAITHQVLWTEAFDDPPRLGDRLAGLPDEGHEAITRTAAVVSSVLTGAAMGAIVGLVATGLRKLLAPRG
jgi:hypothetical protein